MPFRLFRRARSSPRRAGFLVAMIALVSQLALGGLVPPDDDAVSRLAALDAVSILCSGHQAADPKGGQAPHRHHAIDLALCPLAIALAVPDCLLPTSAPLTPARSCGTGDGSREPPPGRGPPAATARVGAPRAPPVTA